jgi:hypothetical protein
VVRSFEQKTPPRPNSEIIDHGFFATGDLPADTSPATRQRIVEIVTGRAPSERW